MSVTPGCGCWPVLLVAVALLLLALAVEGWLLHSARSEPTGEWPVSSAPVETAAALRSAADEVTALDFLERGLRGVRHHPPPRAGA